MKKIILIVLISLLCLWAGAGITDYVRVIHDKLPIFCLTDKEHSRYYGLGYMYDAYNNPVTGNFEYAFYLFGKDIVSTFTD